MADASTGQRLDRILSGNANALVGVALILGGVLLGSARPRAGRLR